MRKKKVNLYHAKIKVLGQNYESYGVSVLDAVGNLQVSKGRGMSVLEVSKGSEVRTKVLSPTMTMRLFHPSKMYQDMAYKNINSLFDI